VRYTYPSIAMRDRARSLRRAETDAEHLLWRCLRGSQLGTKFRRQQPIGPFIVDFCCMEHKVIVELDGSQHTPQAERDAVRSEYLAMQGYRVLRFWNHDVLKGIDSVLQRIASALRSPHPNPLPGGEGEERRRN